MNSKIFRKERIVQQIAEQVIQVPVPKTQEQVVHVPHITQHGRTHHLHAIDMEKPEVVKGTLQKRKLHIQENTS